ncbi:MAG: L-seryl-tRNA(Sec) selenium transferase, partial [Anaerolineales bacterium]|nr:L-seryl-tRNA(Sec) selenium transferase [Anaerolineales bacterium]
MLQTVDATRLVAVYGRPATLEAIRGALARAREAIGAGKQSGATIAELLAAAEAQLSAVTAPTLQPVINATGVIIHTNLGRSVLSAAAERAIAQAARSYDTLEYDLETGKRGSRSTHVQELLARVTGAEAAT